MGYPFHLELATAIWKVAKVPQLRAVTLNGAFTTALDLVQAHLFSTWKTSQALNSTIQLQASDS